MRIAYLVNQYPKTSHTFIRREIQALERAGVQVMRISLRGWDSELVDPEDLIERNKTHYVLRVGAIRLLLAVFKVAVSRPQSFLRAVFLMFRAGWRTERPLPIHFVYLAEASQIVIWLKQTSVRHLHAHFGTNSAEVAMLCHVLGGPQWSFTVHGPEEFDKPHFIGLPEKIKRCSFVVAISSYGRSQLFRLIDWRLWSKVHLVRCGLNSAFFEAPRPPPSTIKPWQFVCVGRLCEQKGQMILLEAVKRLLEAGIPIELVLAGDGEMRSDVDSYIIENKLTSRVRVTGWISNETVRLELAEARALVLPSFAEGLPVVIMESLASYRPVISTFVAGIPELVTPDNGWLVPAGDVEALVTALQACMSTTEEKLIDMGISGYERTRAFHDLEKEVPHLIALFYASREQKRQSA
jgi:colanic acid/amylovoran biosynthesis glycosyltransferase